MKPPLKYGMCSLKGNNKHAIFNGPLLSSFLNERYCRKNWKRNVGENDLEIANALQLEVRVK